MNVHTRFVVPVRKITGFPARSAPQLFTYVRADLPVDIVCDAEDTDTSLLRMLIRVLLHAQAASSNSLV